MKFAKSLMATAFIGYATSVEIGDKYWDALSEDDKWNAHYDWNIYFDRVDEDIEDVYSPAIINAVSFCKDNIEDNLKWCEEEVAVLMKD